MLEIYLFGDFFHGSPVRRWISAPLARGKPPRLLETTLPCHAESQPASISESSQFCVTAGTDPIVVVNRPSIFKAWLSCHAQASTDSNARCQ